MLAELKLGTDRQRRDRVTGLMPGRSHHRPPGRSVARITTAVIALPDPFLTHDRFVVVTQLPRQLIFKLSQRTALRWRQRSTFHVSTIWQICESGD